MASVRLWGVGLVELLVVAALTGAVTVGTSASASAAGASGCSPGVTGGSLQRVGGRGPISVLVPRSGVVMVARTAQRARRLRVRATISIARPVRFLAVQLNGRPIRVSTTRSGRLRLVLGRTKWPGGGPEFAVRERQAGAGRQPRWEVPVRFVVGYRKAHLLGVSLRLGAGTRPAATALWRQPSTGVASFERLGSTGWRSGCPRGGADWTWLTWVRCAGGLTVCAFAWL